MVGGTKEMSYFSVGYWVGKKYVRTRLKTHIVRNSKPVCGVKIGENKKVSVQCFGNCNEIC